MAFRTDLALEVRENIGGEIPGIRHVTRVCGGVTIDEVAILDERGEAAIGRKKGRYVTLTTHAIAQGDREGQNEASRVLAGELKSLADGREKGGVLVVGLGNRMVTADSLGPAVCDAVFVTRHLRSLAPDIIDERVNDVCAVSPGVLGVTGVETGEMIEGIVKRVKPSLIVAIDSLASRSVGRIRTTFQLADTGIAPGSGVKNTRKALTEESLGVPVIALGVPLVVFASTIAEDLLRTALHGADMEGVDDLINSVAQTEGAELVVTPKDIDFVIDACARVISDAINMGLHNGVTLDEVRMLMS